MKFGVILPQRYSSQNAASLGRRQCRNGIIDRRDKFIKKRRTEARPYSRAIECGKRVVRKCDVVRREFAQSATTHKCEVSSGRKRAQRMVGADVRGGAFAPDMLLAGRERETEPAATVSVVRLTDQTPRHLTHVLHARRHKAEPRTAKLKRDSKALSLADGDIRPKRARR